MSLLRDLIDGWELSEWLEKLRDEAAEGSEISQSRLVETLFHEFREDIRDMANPTDDQTARAVQRLDKELLRDLLTTEADHQPVLSALAARCLDHVRGHPASLNKDEEQTLRRLCVLWRPLRNTPRLEQRVTVWDRPQAGRSAALTAQEEAGALLGEIRAASRRQCRVYFPTTDDAQVMVACLTQLDLTDTRNGEVSVVRLAPWSLFTLDDSNFSRLNGVVEKLPSLCGKADPPGHFLLEIFSASKEEHGSRNELFRPPMTLVIRGDSLSLSVCLAAWALNSKRSLRRMCVTGIVDAEGLIQQVHGIPNKLKALMKLFQDGNHRVMFLMPENMNPEAYISKNLTNITINGRLTHCELHPTDLASLVNSERPDVLTDCFDDYRHAVLEWPTPSNDAQKQAGSLFDTHNDTHLVVVPQFDSDPISDAAIVARALVDRITKREAESSLGFAADCPTPLLLPLEQCSERSEDFSDSLVRSLEAGIAGWPKQGLGFTVDEFFRENVLKQVVLFEHKKLWLIVYCGKSLTMMSYEDLQKRIDQLRAHLTAGRYNHLVFVASDYHHYLMLSQYLHLKAAPASTLQTQK